MIQLDTLAAATLMLEAPLPKAREESVYNTVVHCATVVLFSWTVVRFSCSSVQLCSVAVQFCSDLVI